MKNINVSNLCIDWGSAYTSVHMQVCSGNDSNFVVINQKGIDPPSLDLLARAGVSQEQPHYFFSAYNI